MKTYLFNTNATMKDYNRGKWWIDSDIIRPLRIEAETLTDALKNYTEIVKNRFYIDITKNALKNKNKMFRDTVSGTEAVGYVITGSTEFDADGRGWIKQYIDLWVEINEIKNPFTV